MFMMKLSIKAAQHLQSLVFPHACVLCGDTMQNAQGCCASCLQDLKVMPKFSCTSCGIPLDASLAPGPCGACLNKALPQQQTRHLYLYHGKVRDAILAWKLQGQDMGMQWLLQTAKQQLTSIFSPHDLLIPIPMPLYRMRRSGLHHSADLCQKIAALVGCDVHCQLLRRQGDDKRQSSLHGEARHSNLRKSFFITDQYHEILSALGKRGKIWVIDDILTTGATLRHACRAMKQTKQPIFAFSFARTWQDS